MTDQRKRPTEAKLAETVGQACEAAHGGLVAGVMAGMDALLDRKLERLDDTVRSTGLALEEILQATKLDAEARAEFRTTLERVEERLSVLEQWRKDQVAMAADAARGG